MADITLTDLTSGGLDGNGVFDVLMKATKAHIQQEYDKDRIKGSEYATVYLGALEATMNQALQFLLSQQKAGLEADLIKEQIENAKAEHAVLVAQECKLRAEYDLVMEQKLKTVAETSLLSQKKVTEQAQTTGTGVDEDSVVGKQKALYKAQTDGYVRDAEQKAAKILAEAWSVRRTTDEGTQANEENGLWDPNLGRAIERLLSGVSA